MGKPTSSLSDQTVKQLEEVRATSPWLTALQAAAYLQRGRRFILREIKSGRLRGAIVGGRREVLTRRDWCDAWVSDQATPVAFTPRRRA